VRNDSRPERNNLSLWVLWKPRYRNCGAESVFQDSPKLPPRYKNPAFWLVRMLLAVVGGGLALAYDITKPLLAANIGAATPLIIKAFSEGVRPSIPPPPPGV
jgi:hypothetical protein